MSEPVSGFVDGLDVPTVARLVEGCRTVASLTAGPLGVVATHLPGQRIDGVRVGDGVVELHVVAAGDITMAELDREVRTALAGHVDHRRVDLVVDDVALTPRRN